jgi:hypothetical protein
MLSRRPAPIFAILHKIVVFPVCVDMTPLLVLASNLRAHAYLSHAMETVKSTSNCISMTFKLISDSQLINDPNHGWTTRVPKINQTADLLI